MAATVWWRTRAVGARRSLRCEWASRGLDLIDPHQGLPHLNAAALVHSFAQGCAPRRKHDDGGTMFEPAHLFSPAQSDVAGDDIGPAVAQMQQHVEKS